MCGICGVTTPRSELPAGGETVASMLTAIAHRGPDARGLHVTPNGALGAVRLAIIDLRGGDQPVYSEDGQVCVVFNGELYNYRDLRPRLAESGHTLASGSDTEILPHLFEEHGIDLVHQLNGMFAFAIWSEREQALYLARDRYGIKPLYYAWDGERLCYASEVKALVAAGAVKPELDPQAALELLTFQNLISERSLFAGVRQLPAGSWMKVDASGIQIHEYWNGRPTLTRDGGGDGGLPGEVRDAFQAAVERQLVSDVEVASYLSGGLDTGSITAAAARRLPRLTTFATGFDVSGAEGMEAGFDEAEDAARLAVAFGTHHHPLQLDPHDMEMVLPRVVAALEEPRMSFSYPNYLTAGFASRWVKVVLSGAGGDEVFGGYPWRYEFAERADFRDAYFGFWSRLIGADERQAAFTPEFLAAAEPERPRALFESYLDDTAGLPPLDQALYFESRTYLHGLLVLEDKLSMAHSLESRVPFLDNELVDLMLEVPAAVKLAGGRSKDLFRRAMLDFLPEEVVTRKKTGFTPPQAAWFRGPQLGYVERVLTSERASSRGVFRNDWVRTVLREHADGSADRRLLLWTLLSLEWWHRIFIDREHVT